MSKPRYIWWPYVKGIIRRYPELSIKFKDIQSQLITSSYSGIRGSPQASRKTESAAIRELPTVEQREYEAVRKAIEATELYKNGLDRIKIVRLVLWDRTHTIAGAAIAIPCSIDSAKIWHGEFIRLVASFYGLMD
ncbi:MAG: hypothetical protein PHO15_03610 [Eubacteriales bacterium]|nr:hypothetical protein [Eubacteriales bacterium]